jgi:3-isopropylmalate/(R)-2-methylmalate dehydratase small subunit
VAIERIDTIRGRALPLRGDNIDTDRIIPARFLKSVSFEGLEQHLFEDDVAQAAHAGVSHATADPRYRGASVLVVNRNFGCGSSREHAPQAIFRRGFRAAIGESFSEIFFGNSVVLGMPCVTASESDVAELQALIERSPDAEVVVDLKEMTIAFGGTTRPAQLPPAARDSFLAGTWDATALLLDRFEDVERTAAALPYVRGWTG